MFRTVRLLALGALLFLGACATKPHVIQKAQKDDGSTVQMRKGESSTSRSKAIRRPGSRG